MRLSDQRIAEFTALYKAEFGIELNRKDAEAAGFALIRLVRAVYAPYDYEKKRMG